MKASTLRIRVLLGNLVSLASLLPALGLTLGNTVWNDLNGNGFQDPLEPGVGGVVLQLFQDGGDGLPGNDPQIGVQTTAPDGIYAFTGLDDGTYYVLVDPGNFLPGEPLYGYVSSPGQASANADQDRDDDGMDVPAPAYQWQLSSLVTLTAGGEPPAGVDGDGPDANQTLDLGFYQPPTPPVLSVGGTVWRDQNGDARLNAGEPGITGFNLHLQRVDGSYVGSRSPEPDGAYRFDAVPPGEYRIWIESWTFTVDGALFGLASVPGHVPANDDLDGDDSGIDPVVPTYEGVLSTPITLSLGGEPYAGVDGDGTDGNQTIDFGFYAPPIPPVLAAGGVVWNDLNGNSLRDPGEPGLAQVPVILFKDQGDGVFGNDFYGNSRSTDAEGRYLFTGLEPGDYFLRVDGWAFTEGGSLFGLANSPGQQPANSNQIGDDSGLDTPAPLQDGIVSTLLTLSPGGEPDTAIDGDGPDSNRTIDFGFLTPAEPPVLSLGITVFRDLNGNGHREPTDSGIPNVVIYLFRDLNNDGGLYGGDALAHTGTTDANGLCRFTGLPAAVYGAIIWSPNFAAGGALLGLLSSPGVAPADNDIDDDDNGIDNEYPVWTGLASTLITLSNGGEPDLAVDGDGPDGNRTLDFGFYAPPNPAILSLGGVLWRDTNGDGHRDPGEPGIAGASLTALEDDGDGLYSGGERPVAGTSTDADGRYLFSGLRTATHFVRIDGWAFQDYGPLHGWISSPGAAPANDDALGLDDGVDAPYAAAFGVVSTAIQLAPGDEPDTPIDGDDRDSNRTVDFGFISPPNPPVLAVGDLVWMDLDGDGHHQTSEPGVANVGISLIADSDGNGELAWPDQQLWGVGTDPEGRFRFSGLPAGRYFVRIESYNFQADRPLFALVSSPGYVPVNDDLNDDDSGIDHGFPSIYGILSSVIDLGHGSEPGEAVDGDDANRNSTADFGFYAPSTPPSMSIGNQIWRDLNHDGLRQPGEPGIPSVGISLLLDDGNGTYDGADLYLMGAGTDADGRFQFTGLPPANYYLRVESWNFGASGPLFGLLSSPGHVPVDSDLDHDDSGIDAPFPVSSGILSTLVTLTAGGEPGAGVDGDDVDGNQTADFGFHEPASPPVLALGDTIWNDLNANGHRDPGEPGLPFVGLNLFADNGDGVPSGGDTYVAGAGTDADGRYRFTGLPAGDYYLRIEGWNFSPGNALAGLFSTPSVVDPDSDVDNDDNGIDQIRPWESGVLSPIITLANGTEPGPAVDLDDSDSNATLDFGFIQLPGDPELSVGGRLFRDFNNNGLLDPGGAETGVEGVRLVLFLDNGDGVLGNGDQPALSAFADADGAYRFAGLPPGDYLVVVPREAFWPFMQLHGWKSSTGNGPAPDPDTDLAHDDNGDPVAAFGSPFYGVATSAVSLRTGAEPSFEDGDPRSNLTVDLGFQPDPGLTVGNLVFRDDNNNGRLDTGEAGIPGVEVELWHDDGDGALSPGDFTLVRTNSNSEGQYSFTGLVPGDYLVVLPRYNFWPARPLNGLRSSTGLAPVPTCDTDIDNDNNGAEVGVPGRPFLGVATDAVSLREGAEPGSAVDGDDTNGNLTVDLGFYPGPTVAVGNLIFRDDNDNQRFDPGLGETGIGDVVLELWLDDGDGLAGNNDEFAGQMAVDSDGTYSFAGLPPGEQYLVTVPFYNFAPGRALNGLRSSGGTSPAPDPDNDVDHDDNGELREFRGFPDAMVATRPVTLTVGEEPGAAIDGDGPDSNATVDLGFAPAPSLTLAGTLFRDLNNNAIQEPAAGESGVEGVFLEVWLDNGDGILHHGDHYLGSTFSGADGLYSFTGLLPGNYLVSIRLDQFFYGRPLTGFRSSDNTATDPDDDVDGDDNGDPATAFDDPNFGIATRAITLVDGGEPDTAMDGDGPFSNATLDLGFRPVTGTTFVVNSTADPGDGACDPVECTLREALAAANANPGTDTIRFAIPGSGPHTIRPLQALPIAIEPVVLDATSQPGYLGTPLIELVGSEAGPGVAGLILQGGFSTVRGFAVNRFNHGGIHLLGGGHNVVQANFVGTDPTGTLAPGNGPSGHGGIYVGNSDDNLIGGTTPADRNVVSGNEVGIHIEPGNRNRVLGNYIGTDVTGTLALGNYDRAGVMLFGGAGNRIGGPNPGEGNLISGNNQALSGWGAGIEVGHIEDLRIEGNLIGTDVTGQFAIPNNFGVLVGSGEGADRFIGGSTPGAGNLISGNRHTGISLGGRFVIQGNLIGTDLGGSRPLPNEWGGLNISGRLNLVGGTEPGARNVISGNANVGINICGSEARENRLLGNWIGLDRTGTVALGNGAPGTSPAGTGIFLCSDENQIGSPEPGGGNVIAGHGPGIDLRGNRNRIQGNLVGTDPSGLLALPNGSGIGLYNPAQENLIGGPEPGAGNLVSGNLQWGLSLGGPETFGNRVEGNLVGTDLTGLAPLPNGEGLYLFDALDNRIGGPAPGAANHIAYNQGAGIRVEGPAINNSIRANRIHDNGSGPGDFLGIDLVSGAMVTPNDPGDSDEGPNRVQNYPVLLNASASASTLTMDGHLNSAPDSTFTIDFYGNAACDPSGYGEGETWLGQLPVNTDASGNVWFVVNLPVSLAPGQVVTATATDSAGNTSEFSACRTVEPEGPPAIASVSTEGRPDRITVLFTEAIDPVSAANPAHYSLDCPGSVVAVAVAPDSRTVWLTIAGLGSGPCHLAVSGVTDRASPPNEIATGSTSLVLTSQGVLSRFVYRGIGGSRVQDLTSAPAFPDAPSDLSYEPIFENPPNYDDYFGQRLAGYLIPGATGDYVLQIVSDDAGELWLSTDENPANRALVAKVTYFILNSRAWNDGLLDIPADAVLTPETRYIESEDFDFDGGQTLSGLPIGMDGPYPGGSFAGLGSPADAGLDWFDTTDVSQNPAYRPATPLAMYQVGAPENLDRGAFQVSTSYKVGWNFPDEWRNYTRDFGSPAREYFVFLRGASGGEPIAARLDEVTSGVGTPTQTTVNLGEFRSPATGGWDNFTFIPLTDTSGNLVRVNLGGLRTLRFTHLPGAVDVDYLAFVPAGPETPVFRPENQSAPIHLVAGQRYYVEALTKDGGGPDQFAAAWRRVEDPPLVNGDPPISGQFLSSLNTSGPVVLLQEPADLAVGERGTGIFSLVPDGTPPFEVTWHVDGVPISQPNSFQLVLGPVSSALDGTRIHAIVRNAFSSATTRIATLTVIPDTTPPSVNSVAANSAGNQVVVQFSEAISPASAGNPAAYTFSDGLAVTGVSVLPDQQSVAIQTSPQTPGLRYALTLTGIFDTAENPNAIAPGTVTRFSGWIRAPGFARHRFFQDVFDGLDGLRGDPRFPDFPTFEESLAAFEWPPDAGNDGGFNYGNQISGWLRPPVSGLYRFYVNSDDPSELYLSTDEDPAHKVLIATEPQWNNPRSWRTTDRRNPGDPENESDLVPLEAGRAYWIEAIHTEGGGGDNLAVTWQLPGAPEVQNGDPPITGEFLESLVNPDPFVPSLSEVVPDSLSVGGPAFTLVVRGSGFRPGAFVLWNGATRPTTYLGPTELSADIPASDLAVGTEVTAVPVSVRNAIGPASDPLAVTLTGSLVEEVTSTVATAGGSATASVPPATESSPGVTATVSNAGSSEPIVITTTTFTGNPAPTAPAFEVGGGYLDVKVAGGDPEDTASVAFYYPAAVTGPDEASLELLYFDGSAWTPVLGSSGATPDRNTTDNLDGTLSGGRFLVVFDATSTPKLTDLTGTFFTFAEAVQRPPEPGIDVVERPAGRAVKVAVAQLLANDLDPDGDPLSLTGVSSLGTGGGEITLRGSWVFYVPPPGPDLPDSFTYTVSDGGRTAVGQVMVLIAGPDTRPSKNTVRIRIVEGVAIVTFAGIPGRTYQIQATPTLEPAEWVTLGSQAADPTGLIIFTDPEFGLHPSRFYRTVEP